MIEVQVPEPWATLLGSLLLWVDCVCGGNKTDEDVPLNFMMMIGL